MPKEPTFTKKAMTECKNCHCGVGEQPKISPFRVDGGNNDFETFCPPCFVYVRAPKEPLRFTSGRMAPVRCASCGWSSVASGRLACGLCSATAVIVLPPVIPAA